MQLLLKNWWADRRRRVLWAFSPHAGVTRRGRASSPLSFLLIQPRPYPRLLLGFHSIGIWGSPSPAISSAGRSAGHTLWMRALRLLSRHHGGRCRRVAAPHWP